MTKKKDKHTKSWLGLPIIATVTQPLCYELTLQVEYLKGLLKSYRRVG